MTDFGYASAHTQGQADACDHRGLGRHHRANPSLHQALRAPRTNHRTGGSYKPADYSDPELATALLGPAGTLTLARTAISPGRCSHLPLVHPHTVGNPA